MPSALPTPPAYRAPGGFATDVAGGLSAFAERLQDQRDRAALEAYRQAQLKLQQEQLSQQAGQGELDRELKKYLGELQAQVDRERNERIRSDQERDRAGVEETAVRDLRRDYEHQLGTEAKGKVAEAFRRMTVLSQKKSRLQAQKRNLSPVEQEELDRVSNLVGLAQMGTMPELQRADSLKAFERTAGAATGPLSGPAAGRLRQSLGFDVPEARDKPTVSEGGGPSPYLMREGEDPRAWVARLKAAGISAQNIEKFARMHGYMKE